MTKPYREGAHWSFRLRIQGQDIYRSGFTSLSDARRALDMEHHANNVITVAPVPLLLLNQLIQLNDRHQHG